MCCLRAQRGLHLAWFSFAFGKMTCHGSQEGLEIYASLVSSGPEWICSVSVSHNHLQDHGSIVGGDLTRILVSSSGSVSLQTFHNKAMFLALAADDGPGPRLPTRLPDAPP